MNNLDSLLNKAHVIISNNKNQKSFIISVIKEESGITVNHNNITISKDGYIQLRVLGLKRKIILLKKDIIQNRIKEKFSTIQFL